jgi:GTP diphosphokinase / guanosine-3',5'-bis(diphosphate) 3'-diphosphatase
LIPPTEPSPGQHLIQTTARYLDRAGQELVRRALETSVSAHQNHYRLDGSPYSDHAIAVAHILARWQAPAPVMAAGLLHDVHKEKYAYCPPLTALHALFGEEVTHLLHELAQLGRRGPVYPRPADDNLLDTLEHMVERVPWVSLNLQRLPHVGIIRLADRLHNFQTLHLLPPERQIAFAFNVMSVYVPFADRIGMGSVKRQLEDDAFQVRQPQLFNQTMNRYGRTDVVEQAQQLVTTIQTHLAQAGVTAAVHRQPTSYYQLYQQESGAKQRPLPHLVWPVQIVAPQVTDCYHILGLLHERWPPQADGLIDLLHAPKGNGYRALHTTIRLPAGGNLPVCIQDEARYLVSEFGLTATWRGIPAALAVTLPHTEIPADHIIVFTPDGDTHILPKLATPIDFAYAVHIGLGHQCTGAVVNGRKADLHRPLENGDVVKILTSSVEVGPSPEWQEMVRTSRARRAIKRYLNRQKTNVEVDKGRLLLARAWQQRAGQSGWQDESAKIGTIFDSERLTAVAIQAGYDSLRNLYIALALGQETASAIVTQLQQQGDQLQGHDLPQTEPQPVMASLSQLGVRQVQVAGCCKPQPPDTIVAYRTSRRGWVVHRPDCSHIAGLVPLLKATWQEVEVHAQAEIYITAVDRPGLASDTSLVAAEMGLSMTVYHAEVRPDGSAQIYMGLGQIGQELELLLERLRRVVGVRQAQLHMPGQDSQPPADLLPTRYFNSPYTLNPVTGRHFYGRSQELNELVKNLRDIRPGEAVLLWGPRRVGKTSLLLQFQENVMNSQDYVVAFVDMQSISGRSTTVFLRTIIHQILRSLHDSSRPPKLGRMKRDPLGYFSSFLENEPRLRQRHIVLILDEFQVLSTLAESEVTLSDINRYWRGLIQHRQGVTIVFSGGGLLDRLLAQPSTSFMLEVARHQKVSLLTEKAARQLIVEPVPEVTYEEAVVVELLRLTQGHPYYLQLVCGELVRQAGDQFLTTITPPQLEYLLENWLPQQGQQFFTHLWGSHTGLSEAVVQRNQLVVVALAHQPDEGAVTVNLEQSLAPLLDAATIWSILQDLVKMDTVQVNRQQLYRIRLPLCQCWLRANYSVAQLKQLYTPG